MKWIAVVCVFVVTIGAAHAQSTGQPAAPDPGEVSPTAALMISLGGTLASYGAVVGAFAARSAPGVVAASVGAVIMPSVGRWYANDAAAGTLAIRIAGTGAVIAGVALEFNDCVVFFSGDTRSCNRLLVSSLIMVGGVAFLGTTVYDIVRAPLDARDDNAAHRRIALVPVVAPQQHQYGIAFAGQF